MRRINLTKIYTKRMLKNIFRKRNMATLIILLLVLVVISLTISFAPLTPATRSSLIRLARTYFNLPVNDYSIAFAFFAIELPPFIALFASVMVATIPQKTILYERTSGNMEILLSNYGNVRSIALALMLASIVSSLVIYLIFTGVGLATIFLYQVVYHTYFEFPRVFYILMFLLTPLLILLSVSISLLLTVMFPVFSSIETYTLSSNPLVIVSYLPSLIVVFLITLLPLSPEDLVKILVLPVIAVLLLTLILARRCMKRDVLVRK